MSRNTMVTEGLRKRRVMKWILALSFATGVVIFGGCTVKPTVTPPRGEWGMWELRVPAFPWPPPRASVETTVPHKWLPTRGEARLADVARKLTRALRAAKYPKWSYSSVPNGFVLVSQMEQIKSDGTPSPEPARWRTEMPQVSNMTLLEFIRALANAQPGYYRV